MELSDFGRRVQEYIAGELEVQGITDLPEQWERNDAGQYLGIQFNKIHNRSNTSFRIVMSVLRSPLDNRNIGFMIVGFIADSNNDWIEAASLSILENAGLHTEGTIKAFRNYFAELFWEEPTPIEKAFRNSLIGERIMKMLGAKDIVNLMTANKGLRKQVGHPSFDILVWKILLKKRFGENAVQMAERRNVTYYSEYRAQVQDALRRRQEMERDMERSFASEYAFWPRASSMNPDGVPFPLAMNPDYNNPHIGENHRSNLPPSMRPMMFGGVSGPDQNLPNPVGGDPDRHMLMGDGFRREPAYDDEVPGSFRRGTYRNDMPYLNPYGGFGGGDFI